ncbi:MAG: hypothetical protein ACLQBQ_11545 [Smithella sp.]
MKRTIMLLMALMILLVSIGGCWPWRHEDDKGGVQEEHNRNDYPNNLDQKGPGVPDGGGPHGSGGGH